MSLPTLVIVGAPEEMGCGGSGCPGCVYASSAEQAWACRIEIPGDPAALASRLLREVGQAPGPALGHAVDAGHLFDVEELDALITRVEHAVDAVDDEGHPAGRSEPDLYNERQALLRSLPLLRAARKLHKRVLLEV